MTQYQTQRGATAVGVLSTLPPIEFLSISFLRLWNEGPDGQAQIWNKLACELSPNEGRKVLKDFETTIALFAAYARRPLVHHCVNCTYIGADEATFASMVSLASEGEREEVLLQAMTLLRCDIALIVLPLLTSFGLALRRITLNTMRSTHSPVLQSLH